MQLTNNIPLFRDSIKQMKLRIEQLESLVQQQQHQIEFADTCIVRQANNALSAPYNERRIHSAQVAFDRMNSAKLRDELKPLRILLDDYGHHYMQLIDILRRADADRDLRNPFTGKDTAKKYIDEIRQMPYCIEVMDQEWVIPYMSQLIQIAINRLKSNDPGERQTVILKDLLTQ